MRAHSWWPIYRSVRRQAAHELRMMSLPADQTAIDRYLEIVLPTVFDTLQRLFLRDRKYRTELATQEASTVAAS